MKGTLGWRQRGQSFVEEEGASAMPPATKQPGPGSAAENYNWFPLTGRQAGQGTSFTDPSSL